MAVLRLLERTSVPFWHGGVLIGFHLLADVLVLQGMASTRLRTLSISVLVATQSFVTARIVWRAVRSQIYASAIFSAVLLTAFGFLSLL